MPPTIPTSPSPTSNNEFRQVVDAIRARRRFLISSHSRPDGDSIGSQLAMAYALRALGKEVRVINKDPAPDPMQAFPGVPEIELADRVTDDFDGAIIMECGDLGRPGVAGLERLFVINIDHHPGNAGYGQVNWFDASAAACAVMVFDLVEALGVPLSLEIATHVYVGILTDTGSFHYSSISPRTFEICRKTLEAGVDPVRVSRQLYDSISLGRLRLIGMVMTAMEVDPAAHVATLYLDHAMARGAGGTYDDTEGLVNMPLSVNEIWAVVFFKEIAGDEYRVSLRSKGDVDVGAIAQRFGGGGHKNAAGCTVKGPIEALKRTFADHARHAVASSHDEMTTPTGQIARSHDQMTR